VLESKNYAVESLSLLITPRVPEDALAVVVAGPTAPVSGAEVEAVKTFLGGGGGLVLLADPIADAAPTSENDRLAEYLSSEWGLELRQDIIVDWSSTMPLAGISAFYAAHPVTEPLGNTYTYFPSARSLLVAEPEAGGTTRTELILTGQNSWGETDVGALAQAVEPEFSETSDTPGPLAVAAAAEDPGSEARVVVVGDSDFGANVDFGSEATATCSSTASTGSRGRMRWSA
jgi:hypothetical protein